MKTTKSTKSTKSTNGSKPAKKPTQDLLATFKAARRVSAPIVAIATADPAATIRKICGSYTEAELATLPLVQWDCVRGMRGMNDLGNTSCGTAGGGPDNVGATDALSIAAKLQGRTSENPRGTILFCHNMHRFLDDAAVAQAVWNLRDEYKEDRRTLVLLAPSFKLPTELTNDVILIDEALPTDEDCREIFRRTLNDAGTSETWQEGAAVNATSGLPAFTVEQSIAMSLGAEGVDIEGLWERKRKAIEQAPGLKIWKGTETFQDVTGLHNVKDFLARLIAGKNAPRVVVYIDEIEKAFAAAGSDSSGTTQDQLQGLLTFMQDERAKGSILLGPPGTGKSQLCKAFGNEANTLCIQVDLGAMKDGLVGSSEARLRAALKVIKAIGQDRVFFVATCNSIGALPPELRRRFKSGTFFMDLPDAEERAALWALFMGKHGVTAQDVPESVDWTGAEIEQCCEYAADFGCTLREASAFIVPVAKSAAEIIDAVRNSASGRYLSASKPGLYKKAAEVKTGKRDVAGHAENV